MATALGNAVKSCIEDNWSAVTGGAKPNVYDSTYGDWPEEDEWIRILPWSMSLDRKRLNDDYVQEKHQITFRVQTQNDATNEENRLDEMVTELYRIVTPTNLTGFHEVDITYQDRRATVPPTYRADLTITAMVKSTSSAITPGSTETSDWTVDNLTVNTSFTNSGTTALAGNITTSGGSKTWTGHSLTFVAGDGGSGDVGAPTFSATTDVTIAGDSIAEALMLGSTNAAWVPCIFHGGANYSENWANIISTGANGEWGYVLPLPTTKGSLKLYVAGTQILLEDADDPGGYITQTYVYGRTYDTNTELDSDGTNKDAPGKHEDTWTAVDASSHDQVHVRLSVTSNAAGNLDVVSVKVKCYYA
jgi:hypothetical protein